MIELYLCLLGECGLYFCFCEKCFGFNECLMFVFKINLMLKLEYVDDVINRKNNLRVGK